MPRAPGKTTKTRITPYDVAEHLRTTAEMSAYLDAWLEEAPDDASGMATALGYIVRAKGMSQVAKDAGLSRESLYRALSAEGHPSSATVLKVARGLGVKLHAQAAQRASRCLARARISFTLGHAVPRGLRGRRRAKYAHHLFRDSGWRAHEDRRFNGGSGTCRGGMAGVHDARGHQGLEHGFARLAHDLGHGRSPPGGPVLLAHGGQGRVLRV